MPLTTSPRLRDTLRLLLFLVALLSGPSNVGDTANFSTKVSGSFKSAGSDSRLLISSWLDTLRAAWTLFPGLGRMRTPPCSAAEELFADEEELDEERRTEAEVPTPRAAGETTSSLWREPSSLSPSLPI